MAIRDLDEIILYEFLKNLGISLIGIFIPVYILSEGFAIEFAALFILISGLTGIIFSIPLSHLISRIGYKYSLILSYLALIPGILIIRFLDLSLLVIVFSSLFYNIGRVLHNVSLNSEFAIDSRSNNRSNDSGKMLSLPSLSRIIGPLLGGIIFASAGFYTLISFSLFFLTLSVIPLWFTEDHHDPLDYSFFDVFRQEAKTSVPLFFIRGVQAVAAVDIFAIFVFLIIGGSFDVGGARTLDSLGFVLTGLIVGKMIKKHGGSSFVKFGSIGASLIHFIRGFLASPIQVFAASFVGGIFFQIYHVPVYAGFAEQAEKQDVLEYYTLRKIFVGLGNLSVVATMTIFYWLFDLRTGFIAAFVLAGLCSLSMIYFYSK